MGGIAANPIIVDIAGAATAPRRAMVAMVHRWKSAIALIAGAATAPLRAMAAMQAWNRAT